MDRAESRLKYAYYPGCASQTITKEADEVTRKVAGKLGIELYDMPAANCCGSGLLTDYSQMLSLALNARIFGQAEEMGMDIMTICATCLMVMSRANGALKLDPELLKSTNTILGKAGLGYRGSINIKLLPWVLVKDYGLKELKRRVRVPLEGLRIAPFYGCHSLRPSDILAFDDPERPSSLEDIITALGARAVEYDDKTRCCGFQVDLVNEDNALELTGRRLADAVNEGAVCMVTPCPFCHINLDSYQSMAGRKIGKRLSLPVFHIAQLVGIAMGMSISELGLSRHLISSHGVLTKVRGLLL